MMLAVTIRRTQRCLVQVRAHVAAAEDRSLEVAAPGANRGDIMADLDFADMRPGSKHEARLDMGDHHTILARCRLILIM